MLAHPSIAAASRQVPFLPRPQFCSTTFSFPICTPQQFLSAFALFHSHHRLISIPSQGREPTPTHNPPVLSLFYSTCPSCPAIVPTETATRRPAGGEGGKGRATHHASHRPSKRRSPSALDAPLPSALHCGQGASHRVPLTGSHGPSLVNPQR